MEEDKLREIAKEEMTKAIMNNLDSSLIFTYIKNLEDKNKELEKEKERIGKLYYEANENCIKYEKQIENSISKSKVKEKIEELKFIQKRADDIKNGLKIETRMSANKEDRERSKKELEQFEIPELINEYQIKVLQELLEE